MNYECPIEVMNVFDNEGYTFDRYTINILFENGDSYVVASSSNPTHPQGVWSIKENEYIVAEDLTKEDAHIGKEIDWDELPNEVKKTVLSYFDDFTF